MKIPAVFFNGHPESGSKRLYELKGVVANYAEMSEQIGVVFSREALSDKMFKPFGNI